MGVLADRMAELDVRVASRNEQIFARTRGSRSVEVTILPGYAERAGEAEVAAQLARVARVLFAQRAAAVARIRDDVLQPDRARLPRAEDAGFRRAYEGLTVTGRSASGAVTVTAIGLAQWVVELRPGAAGLGNQVLSAEVTEAANRLIAAAYPAVTDLRNAHYPGRHSR